MRKVNLIYISVSFHKTIVKDIVYFNEFSHMSLQGKCLLKFGARNKSVSFNLGVSLIRH